MDSLGILENNNTFLVSPVNILCYMRHWYHCNTLLICNTIALYYNNVIICSCVLYLHIIAGI